tara:strand:- start:117 stop:404 length:288 start_codon:yes stop_codon:yes gene_type:complete
MTRDQKKIKYQRTAERQREKKSALVKYKGGKCCICGYKKCYRGLDFHHIAKKKFALSLKRDCSLEKLKKEADKTILVCRNCHAEIHAGMHKKYKP